METLRRYLAETVLPFSAHYRELFKSAGLRPSDIREPADLARIPFTSKRDLLPTEENPGRARDFVVVPDEKKLARMLPYGS